MTSRANRSHRQSRHRNDSRNRRSGRYFAVRKRTVPASVVGLPSLSSSVPLSKHIVNPPQRPHTLSKMRIEVAVEYRVAHCFVLVPATVEGVFQRVGTAGTYHLAVSVAALVVVGRVQPLVSVQVMHVSYVSPGVKYPKLDVVAHVTVVDVARIIRVIRFGRFRARFRICVSWRARGDRVGREVHDHRWIANSPCTQEEFLEPACSALVHRAYTNPVAPYLRTDTRHSVVNRKEVPAALERMIIVVVLVWVFVLAELLECLSAHEVIVIVDRKFPVGLCLVRIRRIVSKIGTVLAVRTGQSAQSGSFHARDQ